MAEKSEERIDGRTPNGGAYSIAYFRDDEGNPTDKAHATRIEIHEFDRDGQCILRTYGTAAPAITRTPDMKAQPPRVYQLKITLNHITPPIWRRLQVRSDVKLTRLHEILQLVMGWENYHLHAFDVEGVEYTDPESIEDDIYELGHQDGSKVKLSDVLPEVGCMILYRYDFGDNWEHTIELEKMLDPEPGERYPVCLDGARSCPPEDCGGIGGYEDLLRILGDPEDEEHEDMREWVGRYFDPEKFNPEIVNIGLPRRVVVKV